MNTKFDETKKLIEILELALTRVKSPEEATSIMFEINRLKNL